MKTFKHLKKLLPLIDNAFKSFYDTMLQDGRLSMFFKNQQQINMLIQKQKEHLSSSLELDKDALKDVYIYMGEYHYDLRIPYIDFIKGTEILQEHFLRESQQFEDSYGLVDEIFEFFKIMKSFTAKGYLNKMLEADRQDINNFFDQVVLEQTYNLPRALVLHKLEWLKKLLEDIGNKVVDSDEHFQGFLIKEWLEELDFLTKEKKAFFEELEQRIMINTQNLFYFLKREEYLEILPLYTSLLNIYKLTLMMNNAVTIEFANKVIEDMKLDASTQLFRKDIFEEVLKKELALLKRHQDYKFCLVYIDLDDFKQINDHYGHYSGDKVIEKVGEMIRGSIRASDFGFRIGGDEFAMILKDATKKQAKVVSEKFKTKLSTYQFIFNDDVKFTIGISMGIEEVVSSDQVNMKTVIENVDWKLYEAKKRGKNQIYL